MKRCIALLLGVAALVLGCSTPAPRLSNQDLVAAVTAAELAFAKTMVDRDHAAFLRFVSPEAVFLNDGKPLVGSAAIGKFWERFYNPAQSAPFTWRPDLVVVLASGTLAQSVGPVANGAGKVVSRFYSTWRLEADGQWRVVFDDGYDLCDCPAK